MATHKSSEKRARQTIRKNKRNTSVLGGVRTWERKLREALGGNDKSLAETLMTSYMSKISKAAAKGVVHKKTAARKISRIAERISKLATK